jgi:c-di-GMP-binding flagellar brake protein YcgR
MPPTGGLVSVVGARLVNVSAHGMMIESPVPMETDCVLQFRLVVAGEKVDVEARVANCHVRPGEKRKTYGVGLEFVKIPEDARQRLVQALKSARTGTPAA